MKLFLDVGDITHSHGYALETDRAYFLDGDRVNTNFFSTGVRVEPIRNFIFDVSYNYLDQQNLAKNISDKESYLLFKFTFEY